MARLTVTKAAKDALAAGLALMDPGAGKAGIRIFPDPGKPGSLTMGCAVFDAATAKDSAFGVPTHRGAEPGVGDFEIDHDGIRYRIKRTDVP